MTGQSGGFDACPLSCFFFRPPQIPETRPRPSGVHGCCPLPKEGTQRLIGPNMGGFFFSLPFGPRAEKVGVGVSPQAERLACHWQPNAFCGLTPTPTFAARGPKGREKKCAFAQCRNYDAVDKEEAIFSLSLTSSTIPPPFGPVSRCVGRMGTGKHPCPQTPACGPCQAVWRKSETAAETRFHPKIGGEPTG